MMHSLLAVLALAAPGELPAIDIPYQAAPAFISYSECVSASLAKDPRGVGADLEEVRRADRDAVASCRTAREAQVRRALDLLTDYRPYGSRAEAEAAVRKAFDRFDSDYVVEPLSTQPRKP